MKNPILTLGLVFRDHVQFKRAVIMYSLVNGYGEIHFLRNEKLKVTVKCAKCCPWKCCAGKIYSSNSIRINTIFDEQTCGRTWANKNLKSPLLTDLKAYKALYRALKIIEGKHAEQYTKLWDFAKEVKKTNPESTVKVKLDRQRFQRIYVCLGACKEGFKSGLVEIENKSNWIWFLELPAVNVGICQSTGMNIYQTTTVPRFKKAMEDMKKLDEKADNWFVKKPAHHWSKSHFETYLKCDMLLNNLCESFNVVILVPRQKPIVTMLLLIHILLMKRIQMRRDIMVNKVGDLWSAKFQVDAGKGKQYVVDLVKKTCSCRKYGLTRIPCNHAIAAINFKKKKPNVYVDAYYSKARYLEVTFSTLCGFLNPLTSYQTLNPLNCFVGIHICSQGQSPSTSTPKKRTRKTQASQSVAKSPRSTKHIKTKQTNN
ncbi:unnamed protein product [Malus baccata var. baccata]